MQGSTPEETRLYNANGPLWYRGWAMGSEADVCAHVDDVLTKTGTRRMIMGHTPDFHVRRAISPRPKCTEFEVARRILSQDVMGKLSLLIQVRRYIAHLFDCGTLIQFVRRYLACIWRGSLSSIYPLYSYTHRRRAF